MPRKRNTERVIVVRTDIDGNLLDYDIVNQSTNSVVTHRLSPVYQSQPIEQKHNKEDRPFDSAPLKKTRQDSTEETIPIPREVRYIPKKSNFKIVKNKLDWRAEGKIDTHNDEAMEQIRRAPKKKVFGEKLSWLAGPKVDTHNEDTVEDILRAPKSQVFMQKPVWYAEPKIDSHNEDALDGVHRAPKPRIHNEKVAWSAYPKINTHNEELLPYLRSPQRPFIYDEKLEWSSSSQIDTQNQDYIRHKQHERRIREQASHTRVQSYPQDRRFRDEQPRIDDYNPSFIEHKQRQKMARLPPIESQKLDWEKTSRVNQRNDEYIKRMRQKRSVPLIYREKLRWSTKSPRIDAHNEEYRDHIKEQRRPRIVSQLPQWTSQPKIDTHNPSFTQYPDSHIKPVIISDKLRWHGRPKIDTGLKPDPNYAEHVEYGLTS